MAERIRGPSWPAGVRGYRAGYTGLAAAVGVRNRRGFGTFSLAVSSANILSKLLFGSSAQSGSKASCGAIFKRNIPPLQTALDHMDNP